ncbi:cobyrinic acid a,c-diamide synthase [Haloglomus halophilum]|uniref:cobyrinic acid a,c-diamide synthase n=1 Tax=Haloglomus halophilum TaxID=2962672 RepID=UPI0020C95053|nr:cobyrinic acid a,c-diamide synthase [Haloglomus halophilum]
MRGLVLGGTASGVGKTVATLAVCRALAAEDVDVRAGKAGPDFIDPSHHRAVTGHPSRTLDPWLEGADGVRRNFHRDAGEVRVVEGVMGLYDGTVSSTADVAAALDLPVVLVVDAAAGMESVAATALGFREYAAEAGHDIDVVGVLAQQAHGGRHADGVREALPDDLTWFGRIPPNGDLEIPERHLGLHMGAEDPLPDDALDAAAEHVRTDRLLDAARAARRPDEPAPERDRTTARIAVARDAAFRFCYPATRERLRSRADVTTFSPVAGDPVPDCDGVYLPGGYPELHAPVLASSGTLDDLGERAADGLPVLGECGGLMALAESLETDDGTHAMAGILPAEVRMCDRYQALDHVELRARDGTLTAPAGATVRGHEFHYSEATLGRDARFAFDVVRGDGLDGDHDGLTEHRTLGTYAHVHAASGAFDRFVEALADG